MSADFYNRAIDDALAVLGRYLGPQNRALLEVEQLRRPAVMTEKDAQAEAERRWPGSGYAYAWTNRCYVGELTPSRRYSGVTFEEAFAVADAIAKVEGLGQ